MRRRFFPTISTKIVDASREVRLRNKLVYRVLWCAELVHTKNPAGQQSHFLDSWSPALTTLANVCMR